VGGLVGVEVGVGCAIPKRKAEINPDRINKRNLKSIVVYYQFDFIAKCVPKNRNLK
jgi:hypothetical protein